MYYEVLVNDVLLATVGHPEVASMSLAVQHSAGTTEVFASAVCREEGGLWLLDWLQHPVTESDVVAFRRTAGPASMEPRNRYRMQGEGR